jgi:hypothetical protein
MTDDELQAVLARAVENVTVKAQYVRLIDVFALGPLMVWGGYHAARVNKPLGVTLALFGLSTIAYNADNYFKVRGFGFRYE